MTAVATRALACCVAVAVLAPSVALADANIAAAESAFQKAVKLRAQGKWEEACEAFQQSQDLDPQHGTAFNLAGCYRKVGKLVQAWTLYRELAARDANAGRKAKAAQFAKDLEPRLSYVRLTAETRHEGLVVTLDKDPATKLLGIEAPIDVGNHEVTASAPGFAKWTHTLTIRREGERATLLIPALSPTRTKTNDVAVAGGDAQAEIKESVDVSPEKPAGAKSERLFGTIDASVGMYSAPPGVSVKPAFAVGANATIGVNIAQMGMGALGVGAIANGDVVIDQATFQRFFIGLGARMAQRKVAVHVGPGLSVLTGAGETVLGVGGDLGVMVNVAGRVGVGLHANLSSVAQPFDLMGNLTVLRMSIGVAYSR